MINELEGLLSKVFFFQQIHWHIYFYRFVLYHRNIYSEGSFTVDKSDRMFLLKLSLDTMFYPLMLWILSVLGTIARLRSIRSRKYAAYIFPFLGL